ncbi:MAG TPA: hypothetical protein DDY90_05245 [Clostridiales bacterium]|nr:hypothetical protein [Clostridiales bacterium]HBK26121.1 hypothetical protein [Clostridiales bacterium]
MENGGILNVFPVFQPAAWRQKTRCSAEDDRLRDPLKYVTIVRFGKTGIPAKTARRSGEMHDKFSFIIQFIKYLRNIAFSLLLFLPTCAIILALMMSEC